MNTQRQKILIIDDDERNIFALKAVLSAKGYPCLTALGGSQALKLLQEQPDIGIALVDMMMPGIDGYELMMLIGKMPELDHLRLIAVTAQAMHGDKEKCLAAGAHDYVAKPVDISQLLKIIEQM